MAQKFDPVTLEILWRRLISLVDEADAAVGRTAFSALIRDAHDYTCALFNSKGTLVCQSTYVTPGQLGGMTRGLKQTCTIFPREACKPGDVFLVNDPWMFAGHLNDICAIAPIFYQGKVVAFTATTFHHDDIGGRPGTLGRDVIEEGLFLPLVKLYDGGVLNQALMDVILKNVRVPENVEGDIRSQVTACHVCSEKLIMMMDETSLDSIDDLSEEINRLTERSMRDAIEKVPDGTYRATRLVEQLGKEEDIKIQVAIEVNGSNVIADFDGSSPQVDWGVNIVYNFTYAYVHFALKTALDPHTPNNEGSTRPVILKAPEGSIVNCTYPAAVAARTTPGHLITEIIYEALAPALPDRVLANSGTSGGIQCLLYGRRHTGKQFVFNLFVMGGLGAKSSVDGNTSLVFPGNASNMPLEIVESDTPLIAVKKEMICDSGGPGKMRGGLAKEVAWKVPDDEYAPIPPVRIVSMGGRFKYPAKGLFGGKPGTRFVAIIGDKVYDKGIADENAYPGDIIRYYSASGGGYGDPLERDPEKVEEDVINEYVSLEKAKEDYGVVIDPKTMKVDVAATEKLRESLKQTK